MSLNLDLPSAENLKFLRYEITVACRMPTPAVEFTDGDTGSSQNRIRADVTSHVERRTALRPSTNLPIKRVRDVSHDTKNQRLVCLNNTDAPTLAQRSDCYNSVPFAIIHTEDRPK